MDFDENFGRQKVLAEALIERSGAELYNVPLFHGGPRLRDLETKFYPEVESLIWFMAGKIGVAL